MWRVRVAPCSCSWLPWLVRAPAENTCFLAFVATLPQRFPHFRDVVFKVSLSRNAPRLGPVFCVPIRRDGFVVHHIRIYIHIYEVHTSYTRTYAHTYFATSDCTHGPSSRAEGTLRVAIYLGTYGTLSASGSHWCRPSHHLHQSTSPSRGRTGNYTVRKSLLLTISSLCLPTPQCPSSRLPYRLLNSRLVAVLRRYKASEPSNSTWSIAYGLKASVIISVGAVPGMVENTRSVGYFAAKSETQSHDEALIYPAGDALQVSAGRASRCCILISWRRSGLLCHEMQALQRGPDLTIIDVTAVLPRDETRLRNTGFDVSSRARVTSPL